MTSSHITLQKYFGSKVTGWRKRMEEDERKHNIKHETEKSNNCLLDKDQCVNNNLCVSL